MTTIDHVLATTRFGLGGMPAETADPRADLSAQISDFDPAAGVGHLPGTAEILPQMRAYRKARQVSEEEKKRARRELREIGTAAMNTRFDIAAQTASPFTERLVHFWANHFAVSTDKFATVALAGPMEAEAIRPHLTGNFADMLQAVESHPAMLFYLDQTQSIGPNSVAGQRRSARTKRKSGINENLAREIMELHTLGVRSGYSQSDVTQFAHALTGWTAAGLRNERSGGRNGFVFQTRMHEPGGRTIMGKTYRQEGVRQGKAILADLAVHPATAKHIATKLARHFVADDPPASLVSKLEHSFNQSGGNLDAVYRTLLSAPEAWVPQRTKFKTPIEWAVGSLRIVDGAGQRPNAVRNLMRNLGQELWKPGSPAGFEDRVTRWAAPDALYRRVEAANRLARFGANMDAREIAPVIYGEALSAATALALKRAESPAESMALLLASPEAMWR